MIVDWERIGRRLGISAAVLASLAVAAWLVTGLLSDAVRLDDLWGYLGLAVVAMFVVEVVVVGGSAVAGLLRAGERGERLAGGDVGLLPTPLRRRRGSGGRPTEGGEKSGGG